MSSFSTTELNATINEVWDQEIEDGRYAGAVIMNRVNNRSTFVEKSGDIVNISVDGTYSVAAVGSNGAFTPSVFTVSTVALSINQHYYVANETEDRAKAASFYDPLSRFPREAGKAFAVKYDTDLATLQSGLTTLTAVGTDTTPIVFGVESAREAILRFANANIPVDDGQQSFIIPPVAYYGGLLTDGQLTKANEMGVPKNVNTTGYKFPLLGVPFYTSTVLADNAAVTGKIGVLIHKQAWAIAMQKNNDIKRAERTAGLVLSTVAVVQSLYGFVTVRANHGVRIFVRN